MKKLLILMAIMFSLTALAAAEPGGIPEEARTVYLTGLMYCQGSSAERDMEKAIEAFSQAAAMGYGRAWKQLGDIYYYGQGGISVDYAKAASCYSRGAESGDYSSMHLYADCLYNGTGVDRDPEKAIALYQRLVESRPDDKAEYAWGAYMLGKVYSEGIHVRRDKQLSRLYSMLAASLGSEEAMILLQGQ